jgi:hypothetical protein
MKWVFLASLFLVVACGTPPLGTRALVISWQSNGNPGVPVCGSVLKNCWNGYTVLDMTTEKSANLDTTVVSFTAPTMTDTYEIRVNGYDLNGDPISSKYEVVPVN